MITLPEFSPVLLELGFLQIRYYSLAYIVGIVIGYFYVKKQIESDENLPNKITDNIITYAILGIIIGGRLAYVIFYNASYYLSHPLEVFFLWRGDVFSRGCSASSSRCILWQNALMHRSSALWMLPQQLLLWGYSSAG